MRFEYGGHGRRHWENRKVVERDLEVFWNRMSIKDICD